MKRSMRYGAFVLALMVLGGMVRLSQRALDRSRQIRFVDRSPAFLPRGEVLKALSMGYRGLVADWLWIRTVLYYGRRVIDEDNPYYLYALYGGDTEKIARMRAHHAERHAKGEASHAHPADSAHAAFDQEFLSHAESFRATLPLLDEEPPPTPPPSTLAFGENFVRLLYRFESRGLVEGVYPLLDRVTTVDPHFVKPYLFGGVYVMLETGRLNESIALLEKGRRHNPDRWEFPFYLAWLHWIYGGDLQKVYAYLQEAIGHPGCPPYVYTLFLGLARNLDATQMAALYLQGLYESTTDPEGRRKIAALIEALTVSDRR